MVPEPRPYRHQPFDRSEKLYFLKAGLLVLALYFFRRAAAGIAFLAWLLVPALFLSFVWFKSIRTGDRLIDVLREHVTFIPIARTEGGRKSFVPWATLALILANAAMFYAMRLLSPVDRGTIENALCFLPPEPIRGISLLSPIASMFLHADAGHLWGNMAFLWAFAPAVEERIGPRRFLLLYLATGLIGHTASIVIWRLFFRSALFSLGASGAVAGVMGIFMVRCYFKKLVIPVPLAGLLSVKLKVSSLPVLGLFFVSDLHGGVRHLQGDMSNIGYWTHVGSMAAGFALAVLLRLHAKAAEEKFTEQGLAAMGSEFGRRASIDSLQAALRLNPDNEAALLGLAREYAITRRPEGRELFQRVIALEIGANPDQAMAAYGECRTSYGPGLESDLQYRLAGVFYRKGEHEPAARLLEALVAEPSAPDGTRQRAFFQLVVLLAENNMLEAAHYRLRQFRELYPASPLLQAAEDKLVDVLKS